MEGDERESAGLRIPRYLLLLRRTKMQNDDEKIMSSKGGGKIHVTPQLDSGNIFLLASALCLYILTY